MFFYRLCAFVSVNICLALFQQTVFIFIILFVSSFARWLFDLCFFVLLNHACLFLAVDGWIARRFRQVSRFGAWLDSVIDIIGRTILWTKLSSVKTKFISIGFLSFVCEQSGVFVIIIEWLAFIALSNVNLSLSNDIIVRNLALNG